MTKTDNYQRMWEELHRHLMEMEKDAGKEVSAFSILRYMDGAEENLRKKLAQRNYDSFGIQYTMGQVRYASSADKNSPYNTSQWASLYSALREFTEKGATQIKWSKESQKWIVRKTKRSETIVLDECFLSKMQQEMLCYMADNDLF